jgi:hypothetical protein
MNVQHQDPDPLPTRQDINVYDSLDERCACENFLGKNLEEAEALFRYDFLTYQEDLLFMGPRAFRYYVRAAIRYLRGPHATGDSDAANTFASVLELRLENERNEVRPIARELTGICKHMSADIARFDCEPALYGDVGARYAGLHAAFVQLALTEA